jgi:hypothetical protein
MVDNEVKKESEKEKYLGDYLTSKANSKDTIIARKAQGYGILGEITALLKDVPLGNRRTQIGLELRKAWFHNKCLFNSEVWSSITDTDIKDLSIIDRKILRVITGSQAKVPVEKLYLATSQLPLPHILSIRRILYWHTLLKRPKEELTSQVYYAMKENPLKGDWINLLKEDLEKVELSLNDEELVRKYSNFTFKKKIKLKMRELSKIELEIVKSGHEKVRHIVHNDSDKPQLYLTSGEFSNSQKSILFNLRSSCENNFRDNFHNMNQSNLCQLCKLAADSQEHALTCIILSKHLSNEDNEVKSNIKYSDLFEDMTSQLKIVKLYQNIIRIKKRLLASVDPSAAYPGYNSGHCV